MSEVKVHLVRHGQSTWNVEKRLQGQTTHPPLTEQGRADAARAAHELAGIIGGDPFAIYSSDLARATQTAAIIGERLGAGYVVEPALREQHLGDMQGRLAAELHPEPTPEGSHVSEVRWGGGESIADVHRRVHELFDRLTPTAPPHLVVVTHGDTLRVARAVLAGHGHRDVEWDLVANGTVVTVEVLR